MNYSNAKNLTQDVWQMCKREKKVILLPLILIVLAVVAILTVFFTVAGPLAPFIYPLF